MQVQLLCLLERVEFRYLGVSVVENNSVCISFCFDKFRLYCS